MRLKSPALLVVSTVFALACLRGEDADAPAVSTEGGTATAKPTGIAMRQVPVPEFNPELLEAEVSGYRPRLSTPAIDGLVAQNDAQAAQNVQETAALRERQRLDEKNNLLPSSEFVSVLRKDEIPPSLDVFDKVVWHQSPVRQYLTGTCWSFAGTSLIESEVFRLSGRKVKLAQMYPVYFEYLAKVKRFVAQRGASVFGQGAQPNSLFRSLKEIGAAPLSAFSGCRQNGECLHNHDPMFETIDALLKQFVSAGHWEEEAVLAMIRPLLVQTLGTPPSTFVFEGVTYTPQQFSAQVLDLDPAAYVSVMSTSVLPFFQQGVFNAPDNWWRMADYYNVPLDDFYEGLKSALQKGYSAAISIDNFEPGVDAPNDCLFIPACDIPAPYINQDARELRFANGATVDEHAVHVVGYTRFNDTDWFLLKDSNASSNLGRYKGYYFARGEYIRLKVLTYTLHRDAVKDLLSKF